MWGKKTVAAVIPTSRHKSSIFNVIQEIDSTGYVDEVIIVNNGMDYETYEEVKKTRARIVKIEGYGYAKALREGVESTKADLIVVSDPNGSFKGSDVLKLLSYSDEFDTVFGSRTHLPLIHKGSGMNFTRRIVDDIFGKLISIIYLSPPLTDVGCVLRLTNKSGWNKVVKECKSKSEYILTEWLLNSAKNKINFIEVPVNFQMPADKDSGANSFVSYSLRGVVIFIMIWTIWLRWVVKKLL